MILVIILNEDQKTTGKEVHKKRPHQKIRLTSDLIHIKYLKFKWGS